MEIEPERIFEVRIHAVTGGVNPKYKAENHSFPDCSVYGLIAKEAYEGVGVRLTVLEYMPENCPLLIGEPGKFFADEVSPFQFPRRNFWSC